MENQQQNLRRKTPNIQGESRDEMDVKIGNERYKAEIVFDEDGNAKMKLKGDVNELKRMLGDNSSIIENSHEL